MRLAEKYQSSECSLLGYTTDMNMAEHTACFWRTKVNWVTMQSHDRKIIARDGIHLQRYNTSQCSELHSK